MGGGGTGATGRRRRRARWAVWAVMVVCVLGLAPSAWTHTVAGDRLRTVADVDPAPVAVVFGAGLLGDRPTPYLARRLDAAAELYRAGRVRVVLVTGDNGRASYDEPSAMHRYLTARGVPAERIVSDYAGFDTWDSCSRARRIFGVDRAVLISQGFHVRRAVALCGAAGIEAQGVGVSDVHDATWYWGEVREIAAAGKAALDATFRPDPRFLGPREEGVSRALGALAD
ncbi:SanA/YdcF family protein [Streptomyces sp. BI20]|uniref:SanA/YdcF family protein n=1 Tax=Streptomyces sp. BI20 TaxID=3403460 RepID=UPI003C726359